jgi:hypothetical protein
MTMQQENKSESTPVAQQTEHKPNENAGFVFSSFLKITDPQTGKVLVQTRAD